MASYRYRCDRRIARGEMWETWLLVVGPPSKVKSFAVPPSKHLTVTCEQAVPPGEWIVKTCAPSTTIDHATAHARLAAEASWQRRAAGPGVAATFTMASVRGGDVAEHEATHDDARPGLISERLRGATLASVFDDPGAEGANDPVALLVALTHLVARLHRAGVVHGDLSPRNVLVTPAAAGSDAKDPVTVSLVDFGSASSTAPAAVSVGATGAQNHDSPSVMATDGPVGAATPGFVAPEVVAGASVNVASDVYALGAIAGVVAAKLCPEQGAQRDLVAAWGRELQSWDPADRPTDLAKAAAVLHALAGSSDHDAITVEFGPRPPMRDEPAQAPTRRNLRYHAVAIGVAAIVAIAGIVAWRTLTTRPGNPSTGIVASQCAPSAHAQRLVAGTWTHLLLDDAKCARPAMWRDGVLTVRATTSRGTSLRRYRLGQVGDVVFAGALGCATQPRFVIFRPGTGEVIAWQGVPGQAGSKNGLVATTRRRVARPATAQLINANGCQVVRVSTGNPR